MSPTKRTADFVVGMMFGILFISLSCAIIFPRILPGSNVATSSSGQDPFCLPQKKVVIECDEYRMETIGMTTTAVIKWLNLTNKSAVLLHKELATGNVIQFLDFCNGVNKTVDLSMLDQNENLPFLVDIKTSNASECKHTYLLSCTKLVNEIRQLRNSGIIEEVSNISNFLQQLNITFLPVVGLILTFIAFAVAFVATIAIMLPYIPRQKSGFALLQKHFEYMQDDSMVLM